MGNWNGTVRCSHCYGRGHNRSTCEKLTEQIAARFERLQRAVKDGHRSEDDHTYTYTREQLSKRTGVDPVTGEKVRRRKNHGRVCSYCKESGHNRRTCTQIQADKDMFIKLSKRARADILRRLQDHGIGPGALLTGEQYSGDMRAYLVTGFLWSGITAQTYRDTESKGNSWIVARDAKTNREVTLFIPGSVTGVESYNNKYTVAGRSPKVEPPAGWLACEDLNLSKSGMFDKGEQRDYWFWKDYDHLFDQASEEA